MTGQPTDDELREMLESRASRVSPDTEREAMAGLRAAMRGTPDARGGFAVLPVAISGRGARLPGSIAAVGLVAVLVVAVVGGRLATPQEGAASAAASAHVPESIPTLAVSGPDSDVVPPEVLPKAWTGADLATALAARSIVGQVVVVDGALTTRLCNPGGSCVVDIDGLEGVPVVFPHPPQAAPTLVGPGSQTALRVRADGGLDYLGQVDADARRPLTVNALVREDSTPGRGLFVGGELWQRVTDTGYAPPCAGPLPSCEPDDPAWMLAGVDSPTGTPPYVARAMAVTLSDDFDHDSPASTARSTFLVSSSGGGWQVDGIVAATIAGSDGPSPSPSASSAIPTPVITLPVLGVPLTADELQTMLANRTLDGRLVVIDGELWLNPRPCGVQTVLRVPDDPRSRPGPDRHGHGGAGGAPARCSAAGAPRVHGPRRRPPLPRAAAGGRRPPHHRRPAPRYPDPVPGRPVVPGPPADRRPAAGVGLARHQRIWCVVDR